MRHAAQTLRAWARSRPGRWAAAPAALLLLWLALRFSPMPGLAADADDVSTLRLARDGSLLRIKLSPSGRYRVPATLEAAGPLLARGFVAYEDRDFWWHPGVDPLALGRALGQNLGAGRRVSGASTLTMQLARMMERRPRTWGAKLREALRALQLEARYSKRQILERYLNRVPMGGNLEGVAAASYLYFGKPPDQLSLSEAALLISLPRSPEGRRPDRDPAAARRGRDRVLDRIGPRLGISPAELARARAAGLPLRRLPNPRLMPGLVQRLDRLDPLGRGGARLAVDPALQGLCEGLLKAWVDGLRPHGVRQGAVLVVENRTRSVRAYVGSPDFSDPRGGQINGCDIPRSPGSTLKPLLYGLALDQGLITPKTALYDIPRDYGGYRPANFEKGYLGPVRAEEALARSLNVPAVGLESALQSPGGLAALLRRAGCATRGREALDPGLSVVLGAWPVTLEELTGLYAALADNGRLKPLEFFEPAPGEAPAAPPGTPLVSAPACYLLAETLAQVLRPDLPNTWEASPTRGKVAFKTGTSFGYRDAWCLGYTPTWTVGVWLGNADASGAPVLLGAKAAAPLLISIFNRLTRNSDAWFRPVPGLERRKVCAVSGQPLGPWCPAGVDDWAISGVSATAPCAIHQGLWIRRRDGREACPSCMSGPAVDYVQRGFELWPPDVTRYLRSTGRRVDRVPPHVEACPAEAQRQPPRIINPQPGAKYQLGAGAPGGQRIALSAQAGPDAARLYWFLDGRLVYDSPPDQVNLVDPGPGVHELSVIDSRGRVARGSFSVLPAPKP